ASGGTGGTGGIAGTGGTGGTGGSAGIGGTGGTGGGFVVEPPLDAGADTATDASPDASPDVSDAQPDSVDLGPVCGAPVCVVADKRCGTGGLETCTLVNGCPAWGTAVACGDHRACTGTGAAAA